VVREDAHILYGFASVEERTLFRNLLKVSGVGPRIALAILSGGTAATFAHAVREHDAAALTRIPGVGRKIAERLVVEMLDRIDAPGAGPGSSAGGAGGVASGPEAEAYGALVSLGYKPGEATRLLKGIGVELAGLSTEELIRRALQGAVRA
jgi:Holliday junction DNA helicase RuvA